MDIWLLPQTDKDIIRKWCLSPKDVSVTLTGNDDLTFSINVNRSKYYGKRNNKHYDKYHNNIDNDNYRQMVDFNPYVECKIMELMSRLKSWTHCHNYTTAVEYLRRTITKLYLVENYTLPDGKLTTLHKEHYPFILDIKLNCVNRQVNDNKSKNNICYVPHCANHELSTQLLPYIYGIGADEYLLLNLGIVNDEITWCFFQVYTTKIYYTKSCCRCIVLKGYRQGLCCDTYQCLRHK